MRIWDSHPEPPKPSPRVVPETSSGSKWNQSVRTATAAPRLARQGGGLPQAAAPAPMAPPPWLASLNIEPSQEHARLLQILSQEPTETPAPAMQPATPAAHLWTDNLARTAQVRSEPDGVHVLNPKRVALQEKQQRALQIASNPANSRERREKAKEALVVAIAREIDLAAKGQAAPKLGADGNGNKKIDIREASRLAKPILERAPNNAVFQKAFDEARQLSERKWKADGRTDDQLGQIAAAGERGNYAQVTAETKRQLVELALSAGPSEAAQITALSNRASIYGNFNADDRKRFAAAVQAGTLQAIKDIHVDRNVVELTNTYGKGDVSGAKAFLAKLRDKTNPENTLPGSGSLLASDPKVLEMIDKSINAIARSGPGDGDMKSRTQALADLGLASQNILYNDGETPGKGKQVVDHIAKYVVDKMRTDLPGGHTNVFEQQRFFSTLSGEDLQGGGTSLLAAVAAHTATEGSKEKGLGRYKGDNYLALNSNAQWAMRRSIENFGEASKRQDEKIKTLYNELYHGLPGWGGNIKSHPGLSRAAQLARDMEALEAFSPENKKKAANLTAEGVNRQTLWERQESIELGVKLYSDANKKVGGHDNQAPIQMLFGTGITPTRSKSTVQALSGLPDPYQGAAKDPKKPGTIWGERMARALATAAVTETLKGRVKNINVALGENRLQASAPTDVEKRKIAQIGGLNFGTNAATRLSNGAHANMLVGNMEALDASPGDLVYYLPHTMLMLSAAQTAVLPQSSRILSFPKANEKMAAMVKGIEDRIEASKVLTRAEKTLWQKSLDGLKNFKKSGADGLYVLGDGFNTIISGFGLAGAKQDGVKALGYGTATLSDAMFAVSAAKGSESALIRSLGGPAKAFWPVMLLQLVGAATVGGRGAYNAAHTYDKADADAIQALYGLQNREVAEMLAEHNDLLDTGLMGILETVLPGDKNLLGGDEPTRSAGNILTGAFADLQYNRTQLGRLFNSMTPEQAKELSAKIRDMTAKSDGNLAETQDDLKYLLLPADPSKADLSRYSTVKYNDANKRYEDSATTMHWDGQLWRMPPEKVGSASATEPIWYKPADSTLVLKNSSAHQVQPNSREGLRAWLRNKGYIH